MSRINELFNSDLHVINVGLEMFKDDILKQKGKVSHLEWKPPGGGKPELIALLDQLDQPDIREKIEAANQQAVERIINSQPVLIGFDQAINVVPGMTKKTILHAGPPITWERMSGPMRRGYGRFGLRRLGRQSGRSGGAGSIGRNHVLAMP